MYVFLIRNPGFYVKFNIFMIEGTLLNVKYDTIKYYAM